MAMYLMKPYYATRGGRTTTTTYETVSYVGSFKAAVNRLTNTSASSKNTLETYNIQRCPMVVSSKLSTSSNTLGSTSSITYTANIPKVIKDSLSDLIIGPMYSMNSTNATVICLSEMESSNYSTLYSSTAASRTGYTTVKACVSSLPTYGNTGAAEYRSLYFTHVSTDPSYFARGTLSGKYVIDFFATNEYNVYNVSRSYSTYVGSTSNSFTVGNNIYFEVTDPSKITVVIPPSPPYVKTKMTTSRITMYRATLSETTI